MKAEAEARARAKLASTGKSFNEQDVAHQTAVEEQVLAYEAEVAAAHADASRTRMLTLGAAAAVGAALWFVATRGDA